MSEGEPDVVQHHERLVAAAAGGPPVWQAQQPLVENFVVGMLHEDREQLQRIALGQRGPALLFLHLIELRP